MVEMKSDEKQETVQNENKNEKMKDINKKYRGEIMKFGKCKICVYLKSEVFIRCFIKAR